VTNVITDFTEKKLDTKIKIKSLTLSIFPPGLEINRVRVNKEISENEKIEAEFGKLGFYIRLIEFEERKLTFGEIRIADSVIKVIQPENQKSDLKEIEQSLIDDIFEKSSKLPVRVDTLLI